MSNDSPFRTPTEELQRLEEQIAQAREALREIAARLSQIERHVKRAFGVQKTRAVDPAANARSAPVAPDAAPTLTQAEALKLFDEFPAIWARDGRPAVEQRLSELTLPDLKLLAQELGAPLPRKPSRKSLVSAVVGRVNESVLLSTNRNVTQPLSAHASTRLIPKTDKEKE
jgi:hypothetical protein